MADVDIGLVKQEILSLLVSAKNGLSEHDLVNDYRLYNSNKDLPYRDLGYSSLIGLLRSWPDVCRFQQQGHNGPIKILAVEEESTKHILSMVKGQRQGKSRRRARGGGGGGRNQGRGRGGNQNNDRDNRGARFSENTFNYNNYRGRGNGRGVSNGRMAYSNNRSERSTASARSNVGQSNQNFRSRSNVSIPSRMANQQQVRPSYSTGSSQPSSSYYASRQSTNSQFVDDRRVINNATSLRVTVANNSNNHRPSSSQFVEDEEQYDEEEQEEDNEEQVITNIQTLLTEYSHGIRLLSLNELYQKKFGKSLLEELKIANILLLQDYVDDFAIISRHGEENGSCDHIITLKDPKQVAQTQAHLLQQITDSGIVPSTFRYANNLFSYINDSRFQGHISDIDKNEHCLHIQPVRYHEHIETLMEELHSYYSSPISNSLLIRNIETGLSCVTQYDGEYHRVFIKESDLYKCVVVYVDYGTTEEINKDEQQFKYLLKHFAALPCMAIACRLDDICFIPDDNQWSSDTYNEIYALCKNGPFFIEPTGYMNGLVTIRILDADGRCLNDIVVESKLAVKLSNLPNNQQLKNVPQPVVLTLDVINDAAHCPLPDSESSTPESNEENDKFNFPEKMPSQMINHSSDTKHRCKLIQIDGTHMFYLIRYTDNRPYIPCFSLARLLHVSESDILAETLLPRTRLQQTDEYRSVFDVLKQTNPTDCLHINQNNLFLFDLIPTMNYIEQIKPINAEILIKTLHQQLDALKSSQFWNTTYDCYKPSNSAASIPSIQSSHQKDFERYNELLAHRSNLLCNMLRVNDVAECSIKLESIENELQLLIEKMRLGTPSQQNNNASFTTPSGFATPINADSQRSMNNKTDKLKDLMERCKKLINTILILDDYVVIEDKITNYIQENLPFLSSRKNPSHDEQLYQHYSELLENLTRIVNDLQKKLPIGVNV